jgi:hypothetical protein
MTSTGGRHWYVIIVEPELGPDHARLFPGLQLAAGRGQTTISGRIAGQAELGQLIGTLAAHRLELVSIKRSDQPGNPHLRASLDATT